MSCIHTLTELREQFKPGRPQFLELWINLEDGQAMCALINGDTGWLMYLREEGDAGFSSRNPVYVGPAEAVREYELENGQNDEYPAAWALPITEVQSGLEYFIVNKKPAPRIVWHNDSGDGTAIGEVG
jgi:hypothetical protein